MQSANSKIIIGATVFICGAIMNIISYFKFGSVEFGQFMAVMLIGLVVLFIGIANKAYNPNLEPTAIEDISEPSTSPTSTKIELSLKIIDLNDLVVISFSEYYNILDYSFFWDVVGERKEVTLERKTIFGPEQAILDFSLNKAFDSYGFEFCQLIKQYRKLKNKKLAVCGLSESLKEIYFKLDGKDYLEDAHVFSTLDEALSFYKPIH